MLRGFVGKGTSCEDSANHWIAAYASTRGWIQLPGGIIGAAAGFGGFSGAAGARRLRIFIATTSVLANFRFTPFEP
jgi:hypothetical protein